MFKYSLILELSSSRTIYTTRLSKFLGFTYGPEPRDWQFWFSEPTDKFTVPFFAMAEHAGQFHHLQPPPKPLVSIPGSWVDPVSEEIDCQDTDSDRESEVEQDSEYGDDPDYDAEKIARREKNFSIRIPTALPLTPRSTLLLFIQGGSIAGAASDRDVDPLG